MLEKVTGVADTDNPSLRKLQDVFTRMERDMNLHILEEEKILFPFIEQLVEASKENIKIARPFFGTDTNPTEIMQIEHEA